MIKQATTIDELAAMSFRNDITTDDSIQIMRRVLEDAKLHDTMPRPWFDATRLDGDDWEITTNIFWSFNIRFIATVVSVRLDDERISTDRGIHVVPGNLETCVTIKNITWCLGDSEEFQPLPFNLNEPELWMLEDLIEISWSKNYA